MTAQVQIRFFESLPDEGLLALASHRFEELPEPFRRNAQCNVIVRRQKADGAPAVHRVEVGFDRGPLASRLSATSTDPDPYAALSRAFDSVQKAML